MEVKCLESDQYLESFLSELRKKTVYSGYQLYDILCRREYTDVYSIVNMPLSESMLVYREFGTVTIIITVSDEECLKTFITFLENQNLSSFLLFIDSEIDKETVAGIVSSRLGYDFFGIEYIMARKRPGLHEHKTDDSIIKCIEVNKHGGGLCNTEKISNRLMVRRASRKDLSGILDIYGQFNERVYSEGEHLELIKKNLVYTLNSGKDILGVCTLHTYLPQVTITGGFRILKECQGKQLGSFLLNNVTQKILQDSEYVLFYVPKTNTSVLHIMRKNGFEKIGTRMAFAIRSNLIPISDS